MVTKWCLQSKILWPVIIKYKVLPCKLLFTLNQILFWSPSYLVVNFLHFFKINHKTMFKFKKNMKKYFFGIGKQLKRSRTNISIITAIIMRHMWRVKNITYFPDLTFKTIWICKYSYHYIHKLFRNVLTLQKLHKYVHMKIKAYITIIWLLLHMSTNMAYGSQ